MSFVFNCRNCNAQLMAEDNWMGMETTCPHCGQQTLIHPANSGMAVPEAASPAKNETIAKVVKIVVIVLLGLAVLGGITWGVVYFIENNPFASSVNVKSEEDRIREVAEGFINASDRTEASEYCTDRELRNFEAGKFTEVKGVIAGAWGEPEKGIALVADRYGKEYCFLFLKDEESGKWKLVDIDSGTKQWYDAEEYAE